MKDLKKVILWWKGLSNEAKVKIYWDYMDAVEDAKRCIEYDND